LVTKRKEVISFTRKWVKLEIIKLSEIHQAEKAKYCMFSHSHVEIRPKKCTSVKWELFVEKNSLGGQKERSWGMIMNEVLYRHVLK
jgi:hypothetical protein